MPELRDWTLEYLELYVELMLLSWHLEPTGKELLCSTIPTKTPDTMQSLPSVSFRPLRCKTRLYFLQIDTIEENEEKLHQGYQTPSSIPYFVPRTPSELASQRNSSIRL
jgi:hypothetical protein